MTRDYHEVSASEVIADLNGPGYVNDEGEVWDGEKFRPPGAHSGEAAAMAKYHAALEREEANHPSPLACPNCGETGLLAADMSWFRCPHCGYEEDR